MAKGKAKVIYVDKSGDVRLRSAPSWDFLYEASTVKGENYDLGDRVVLPDGRVFRYAKAGASLTNMKYAVTGYNQLVIEKTSPAGSIAAAIVGAKELTITVTAAAIGVSRDGVIAKDALRGGHISIYNSSTVRDQRGIIGNTALAADGTSIVVYLDAGISAAFTSAVACEILANPYSDVRCGYTSATCGKWSSYFGMPNVLATLGQYFWIQTWGAFRVTPAGSAYGVYEGKRQMMFDQNGGIVDLVKWHTDIATESQLSYQLAGFIMERTSGTAEDAAPFINLQINP